MPLSAARDTPERSGDALSVPVAAGVRLYKGGLGALSATGFAVVPSAVTTLHGFGRIEHDADNTAGANGAISVRLGRKIYRFDNSANADAITLADVGKSAYAVDDATVAKTDGGGTRSIAGKIFDVDDIGVWVDLR